MLKSLQKQNEKINEKIVTFFSFKVEIRERENFKFKIS